MTKLPKPGSALCSPGPTLAARAGFETYLLRVITHGTLPRARTVNLPRSVSIARVAFSIILDLESLRTGALLRTAQCGEKRVSRE